MWVHWALSLVLHIIHRMNGCFTNDFLWGRMRYYKWACNVMWKCRYFLIFSSSTSTSSYTSLQISCFSLLILFFYSSVLWMLEIFYTESIIFLNTNILFLISSLTKFIIFLGSNIQHLAVNVFKTRNIHNTLWRKLFNYANAHYILMRDIDENELETTKIKFKLDIW